MRFFILSFFIIMTFYTEGVAQRQEDVPVLVDTVSAAETMPYNNENDEADPEDIEEALSKKLQENQIRYQSESIQEKPFDKNAWKKASAGLDYSTEKKEEDVNEKEDKKGINNRSNYKTPQLSGAFVEVMKWIFILGAVAIIVILILRFVGEGNVFGRTSKRIYAPSVEIDLQKIEENLHESELDPLIRQAIQQKQYALAIRLYYLAIVKELSLSKAIQWKKDKTNRAYLKEMRPHSLFEPFKHSTAIFEKVWYGDSPIEESDFNLLQPVFQDLLKKVRGL